MPVWEEKIVCKLFLALKSLLVLSWKPANRKSWCLRRASEACTGRRLTAPSLPGGREGARQKRTQMKQGAFGGLGWAEKCVSTFSWGLKPQHRGNFGNLNRFLGSVQRPEEMTKGEPDRHHGGETKTVASWITPF